MTRNRKWALMGLLPTFTMCTGSAPASGVLLLTSPTWGTVTAPASGTTSYSLSTSTGLVSVTSGSGLSLGGGIVGIYLASGLPFESVSYSVSIGAFSGHGVTATSAFINGNSSSGSGNLSALGTMQLKVGGVLSLTTEAALGIQNATVSVTVDFL